MTACSPGIREAQTRRASGSSAEGVRTQQRKVYRFSVVPGGVYSPEELARIRRVDSVAARHYAGIGPQVRAAFLSQATPLYVSYRIQDKVFWTARKHLIPKGERILSDGSNLVRTRCGNRLSSVPMMPTRGQGEPPGVNSPAPDQTYDLTLQGLPYISLPLLPIENPQESGNEEVSLGTPPGPYEPVLSLPGSIYPIGFPGGRRAVTPLSNPAVPGSGPPPAISDLGGVPTVISPVPITPGVPVAIPETGTGLLSGAGLILLFSLSVGRARKGSISGR